MGKVVLRGHFTVPSADLAVVAAALPDHLDLTRAEPGCLVFRVSVDPADSHRFEVYEEFANAAAFRSHQTRVRASVWGRCTKDCERVYQIEGLHE